jgi:hypothetical protein
LFAVQRKINGQNWDIEAIAWGFHDRESLEKGRISENPIVLEQNRRKFHETVGRDCEKVIVSRLRSIVSCGCIVVVARENVFTNLEFGARAPLMTLNQAGTSLTAKANPTNTT